MPQRVYFQYVYLQTGSQIAFFSVNLKLLKKAIAIYNATGDLYMGMYKGQSKYNTETVHQSTITFEEFVEYLIDVKSIRQFKIMEGKLVGD